MCRTTHTVDICYMRKSHCIGYGLCNKEYTQHDVVPSCPYIDVVLDFYITSNCPVHAGMKDQYIAVAKPSGDESH